MIFKEILPGLALRPFVKNYLLCHIENLPEDHRTKPYPTRVEQALVFFARGYIISYDYQTEKSIRVASNAIFGQQVSGLNFTTISNPDFLMLMVIFQPGAMHRLLGFSSNELTCEFCDAVEILNSELQNINDQIANAPSYEVMIERAEEYMSYKLKKLKKDSHPIDNIANVLLLNPRPFSLDGLATQANLSSRQFERKFVERIGVGPKLYSRISRFYQAFEYKETHPEVDWLTLALDFGYTDYNHLAKDFKQFANVSPNLMLKEYERRPETMIYL